MNNNEKHKDVDALLNKIFEVDAKLDHYPLQDLFELRLKKLDITKHQALKILDIDHKILTGFLTGDTKKIDFVTVLKLSNFLEVPEDQIVEKYFKIVNTAYKETIGLAKKRSFIINNFNLPGLKKIGLIQSINDFEHIEEKINTFLGYESIYEHGKFKITAAFSAAKRISNVMSLSFWYAAASQSLKETPNPYEYDRKALIEFFPQIRWYSMNVEKGLVTVAQTLFKFGITLIFVPKYNKDLHIHGATLSYRDKPCIVLTQYTNFYATMWFALIHELYHVLYDWEEIRHNIYHITGETHSVKISEEKANNFARQYLFSDEKMEQVKPHINEAKYVKIFAERNHVHPSVIYSFYNRDTNKPENYAKFYKFLTPSKFEEALEPFNDKEFLNLIPVKKISEKRNLALYNY